MNTINPVLSREDNEALAYVKIACSKDSARPALQVIHLDNGKTEATDGYRMHATNRVLPELPDNTNIEIVKLNTSPAVSTLSTIDDVSFPKTEAIMPNKPVVLEIAFDPKFLADACKGLEGTVKMTFYDKNLPAEIQGSTKNDVLTYALIMPKFIDDTFETWKPYLTPAPGQVSE